MAEQSAKLKVSELDYVSIKSNLVAFLKSQSEFENFDFAVLLLHLNIHFHLHSSIGTF